MTRPPSAGPAARPILKPTPFKAVAPSRSSLATRRGIVDPQAGDVSAPPHAQEEGRRQQERRRFELQRNEAGENHGDRQKSRTSTAVSGAAEIVTSAKAAGRQSDQRQR